MMVLGKTLVLDVEGALLRSSSTFPYFMLVAFEGGGLLRALFLLILYPLLRCLSREAGLRVMIMVCFCGIKKNKFRVGSAVLPKFLMEDVGLEGFELLTRAGGKRVCVSGLPRVMVEVFLKEHLEVDVVVGKELKVFGGYYTGFIEGEERMMKEVLGSSDLFGEEGKDNESGFINGVSSSTISHQHPLFSHCKELYLVSEAEKKQWHPLPRDKHPKPVIFHDGRLAFRPTPQATLAMFLWLPIALPLAFLRLFICTALPYKISKPVLDSTGRTRVTKSPPPPRPTANASRLYVLNHRTLMDPLYVSLAVDRPVAVVTYSVSRVAEAISPIETVRLTRDREADRRVMEGLLSRGGTDLALCPEGTTCREPYLLRFSPLFAELAADEVVPVAVEVHVSMFYATTASGSKAMDMIYFFMNPWTRYGLRFLDPVDTSPVRLGRCSSFEMANRIQAEIGRALGFECTRLSRKDKYLVLAGNDGVVR